VRIIMNGQKGGLTWGSVATITYLHVTAVSQMSGLITLWMRHTSKCVVHWRNKPQYGRHCDFYWQRKLLKTFMKY
jgi:hypothetical protein